jgi:hypothetical protein
LVGCRAAAGNGVGLWRADCRRAAWRSLPPKLEPEIVAVEKNDAALDFRLDVEGLLDLVRRLSAIDDVRLVRCGNDESNGKSLVSGLGEVLNEQVLAGSIGLPTRKTILVAENAAAKLQLVAPTTQDDRPVVASAEYAHSG